MSRLAKGQSLPPDILPLYKEDSAETTVWYIPNTSEPGVALRFTRQRDSSLQVTAFVKAEQTDDRSDGRTADSSEATPSSTEPGLSTQNAPVPATHLEAKPEDNTTVYTWKAIASLKDCSEWGSSEYEDTLTLLSTDLRKKILERHRNGDPRLNETQLNHLDDLSDRNLDSLVDTVAVQLKDKEDD